MSLWMGRLVPSGFALLVLCGIASAQTKVGIVSVQRAVLESAEIKKASADMTAKYKPRQDQIEALERDIAGISQQLQNANSKLTPQQQADLTAQGQRKQRDHDRMAQDLQSDVTAERDEILAKSSQKMSVVVKMVAEEKGLDVVVDSTATAFFKPALDITSDVIAAYDKANPAK
ncbi:MAG TPA: OmpH family outer membrane protein [Bryobacteraceae bacterium]|nr:OmpH family outer membrane protein [Bryobacteraceae bacterium]